MVFELQEIIELLAIMIGVKLILENWRPPIQLSYQALVILIIGGVAGWFMNPTKEGFILGLVGGTIAFWGRKIFAEIKDINDSNGGNVNGNQQNDNQVQ